MNTQDCLEILEREVAPVALSDEFCKKYNAYDNSGIIIDCKEEINQALFSLDFSELVAQEAVKGGYNLIVTHHPEIYGGIHRLDNRTPQARAIALCIKNGVSVISMHLNFDAAPEGIDYWLMEGLEGSEAKILCPLENGGYGRVYNILPINLKEYLKNIAGTFCTDRIICHGERNKMVKKVASFCGAGCDDKAIDFAIEGGADAFVSSDLKHHEILRLVESGVSVIELTHYAAESYGFKKIYNKVKNVLQIPSSYLFDERFA